MRMSEGVEWATHCAVLLAELPAGMCLPAAKLAEYHEVPPAYLAKTVGTLARAGIVESVIGRTGGYRLSRPADHITLLDIMNAVEGDQPVFRCTEIRQRGPAAVSGSHLRSCVIAVAMWKAERAWRDELAKVSVADLIARTGEDGSTPEDAEKSRAWLQTAMRGTLTRPS